MTTDNDEMTMSEFIARYNIIMDCERIAFRSDGLMEDPGMRHWKCTFRRYPDIGRAKTMTTYFSQGSAWTDEPTREGVLDSLHSDVQSLEESLDYQGWCDELGMDPDEKLSRKTYAALERNRMKILRFLGDDAWDDFLVSVEEE